MKFDITGKFQGLFIVLTLVLTACSDKDDAATPVAGNDWEGCRVTQIAYEGSKVSSIAYNDRGLVSKKTDQQPNGTKTYVEYTYDAGNKLVKEAYFDERSAPNGYVLYKYTSNLLTQAEEYYSDKLEYVTTYKYDAANRVTEITEDDIYTRTFTYNTAGNVSESRILYIGREYMMLLYEDYDNNPAPHTALNGLLELSEGSSKNNPGKVTTTYTNADGTTGKSVTTYTYEYNTSNLPTKVTEKDEEGSSVTNYSYECR